MAAPDSRLNLRVNGGPRAVAPGTTLLELVQQLGLDRRYLVVERNGEPVLREHFSHVELRDGDRLELVRPVAGG
jgi:thiamine biosynthesis protein ThiS